jgi:hypothetical protein
MERWDSMLPAERLAEGGSLRLPANAIIELEDASRRANLGRGELDSEALPRHLVELLSEPHREQFRPLWVLVDQIAEVERRRAAALAQAEQHLN